MRHSLNHPFRLLTLASTIALVTACGSSNNDSSPAQREFAGVELATTLTPLGEVPSVKEEVKVLLSGGISEVQDRAGFSLYTFDNDPIGGSACVEGCLDTWPALLASEGQAAERPFTIIDRGDGNLQWALRDKPLYFFKNDLAAGDINGDGAGGLFHVATFAPVLENKENIDVVGEFLVASGTTLVGLPASDSAGFTPTLVNKDRMTLYTFDNDVVGQEPSCAGGCLGVWPPLLAEEGDTAVAPFSLIERELNAGEEDVQQWAYQGKPLYFFKNDIVAGDALGEDANPSFSFAHIVPVREGTSEVGTVLVATGRTKLTSDDLEVKLEAREGFSLYTSSNDQPGVSNCVGNCVDTWPALLAHEGAEAVAPFSFVDRGNGIQQWAVNGFPLYFFKNDVAPGDINGDDKGPFSLARVAPVAVETLTEIGSIFVGNGNLEDASGAADDTHQGFSLYVFANDESGVSNCSGGCAGVWPPLFAPEGSTDFGDFTVIERTDPEGLQWTYKGQPLYFFVNDQVPGDALGEAANPSFTPAKP